MYRKPEGKRPLGRPRRRWVKNIRMDLQEVVFRYREWTGMAQDRDRWRRLVSAYGCETWSLTLREERKLRVFENMVLRRIFGPRRDEVTVEWRRLHNADLNYL